MIWFSRNLQLHCYRKEHILGQLLTRQDFETNIHILKWDCFFTCQNSQFIVFNAKNDSKKQQQHCGCKLFTFKPIVLVIKLN